MLTNGQGAMSPEVHRLNTTAEHACMLQLQRVCLQMNQGLGCAEPATNNQILPITKGYRAPEVTVAVCQHHAEQCRAVMRQQGLPQGNTQTQLWGARMHASLF